MQRDMKLLCYMRYQKALLTSFRMVYNRFSFDTCAQNYGLEKLGD